MIFTDEDAEAQRGLCSEGAMESGCKVNPGSLAPEPTFLNTKLPPNWTHSLPLIGKAALQAGNVNSSGRLRGISEACLLLSIMNMNGELSKTHHRCTWE